MGVVSCFYHICALHHMCCLRHVHRSRYRRPQLWFPVDLIMPTPFFMACRQGAWHVCSAFKIQFQGLYYSSHHYPHGTHFSNFTGFLSKGGYSLSWLTLHPKSYTLVLHHIRLSTSIPMFLLAPCDHPPLTCTSLALISISAHARFILQLQQSGILSLPFFLRLEP